MFKPVLGLSFMLATSAVNAHHGSGGQFDESKNLKVTGVVTRIQFVNPHAYVYFNVSNSAGGTDAWRCEMRAASVLKRSGWTQDMFKPGTHITVDGAPARQEEHTCYVNNVVFDDGKKLERYEQLANADKGEVDHAAKTADGRPNLAGNWAAEQRLLTGNGGPAGARRPAGGPLGGPPAGFPGGPPPGAGRPGGPAQYKLSAEGTKATAGFLQDANPRFHCMATNILMDWTFDQHVNKIEQSTTAIKLTYGFMDIVRTIHLNMTSHPAYLTPSRAGHSIGKWDGDTLVVDTSGFTAGYLDGNRGVMHSDKLHIVEKFQLAKQDKSLVRSWVGDDSAYLSAVFEGKDEILLSQAEYDPYNCKDLTHE